MNGSMLGGGGGGFKVPALQADATLSQANPVSGTKYTVLATTKNVRVIAMSGSVTWTVQPNPLETHGTVDGITYNWSRANPVSATPYVPFLDPSNVEAAQSKGTLNQFSSYQAFLLEARSCKIEVETTGGTVSALDARVKYGKW